MYGKRGGPMPFSGGMYGKRASPLPFSGGMFGKRASIGKAILKKKKKIFQLLTTVSEQ